PSVVLVDGTSKLTGVACPSTTLCSVIDVSGQEATFAPGSAAASIVGVIDTGTRALYGVSCPAVNQCTAVDAEGRAVTYTPQSPASPGLSKVDPGHTLYAVACPLLTQCTAVDDDGAEVSFNPQHPAPALATLEAGDGLLAVACPLATQCTAIDDRGDEITFNPQAPATHTASAIDSSPDVALACPTVTECVAISASGGEVTFNPQAPAPPAPRATATVDAAGQPDALACRTATGCVAVDSTGGVSEGDPNGAATWPVGQLAATGPVDGVVCPSPLLCVAIDASGHAFVGSSGPLPPAPGGLAASVIAGVTKQGRVLTASPGSWSQGPTSYKYQWLRCNGAGGACAPIPAAIESSYTLVAADVGHKLRVRTGAANITGPGAPLTSRATTVVRPLVPVSVSRASLSGIARRRPRLAITLTAGPGEPPLKRFTISLSRVRIVNPGSHRLRLRRAITVGAGARFSATVRGGRLTVTLRKPAPRLRVTVGGGALAVSKALARRVKARKLRSAQLVVIAFETGGVRTRLKVDVTVT
ncbi:MAG: alpha-galactosidase, partial [Solirubrobacteraceae bacterium]|nr:alpha-galactosidase [Solirubrobacteraceae bacterium]